MGNPGSLFLPSVRIVININIVIMRICNKYYYNGFSVHYSKNVFADLIVVSLSVLSNVFCP